jgi:hypothetical protein
MQCSTGYPPGFQNDAGGGLAIAESGLLAELLGPPQKRKLTRRNTEDRRDTERSNSRALMLYRHFHYTTTKDLLDMAMR